MKVARGSGPNATMQDREPRSASRRWLWAMISVAAAAGPCGLLASGHIIPARAATCIHPTLKYYPGSSSRPRWRYGEADFHFDICQDTLASAWTATASVTTNATGRTAGYTFDSPSIDVTGGGDGYRNYDGKFNYHSCDPVTGGFPCASSGTFHVTFFAFKQRSGTPAVIKDGSTIPSTQFALYDTPN